MDHAWEAIETPAVIVEYPRLTANIRRMQQIAADAGVSLRPHVKTHKCIEIARLQIEAGAVGITVAKPGEAAVFLESGIRSLTIAYPLVELPVVERLLRSAREQGGELRFIADSPEGVGAIGAAAAALGERADVFLKVDVGFHRCGLREDDPGLVPLAQRMTSDPSLRFAGLLSHAGHAYAADSADAVRRIAREEHDVLDRVRRVLLGEGIEVPEVSVGSTPTTLPGVPGEAISEIRPGNYVFLDRINLRHGLATLGDVALTVLTRVVSVNPESFIVDAGSKTLSSDRGPHGIEGVAGFGDAYPVDGMDPEASPLRVTGLSEEHGFVARGSEALRPGDLLRVVPNHCCAVSNLADRLVVVGLDDGPVHWPVAARGCVR